VATFTQFRADLLAHFLADTGLTALVDQRIYFQELASLPASEAIYPLVTIRITRGVQSAFVYQQFPLYINAHSDISEDEAQAISQLIRDRVLILPTGLGFVLYPDGTPSATYVSTARLHHIVRRFRCHRLGV